MYKVIPVDYQYLYGQNELLSNYVTFYGSPLEEFAVHLYMWEEVCPRRCFYTFLTACLDAV